MNSFYQEEEEKLSAVSSIVEIMGSKNEWFSKSMLKKSKNDIKTINLVSENGSSSSLSSSPSLSSSSSSSVTSSTSSSSLSSYSSSALAEPEEDDSLSKHTDLHSKITNLPKTETNNRIDSLNESLNEEVDDDDDDFLNEPRPKQGRPRYDLWYVLHLSGNRVQCRVDGCYRKFASTFSCLRHVSRFHPRIKIPKRTSRTCLNHLSKEEKQQYKKDYDNERVKTKRQELMKVRMTQTKCT